MLGDIQSLIIPSSEPGDFGTVSCELVLSAVNWCSQLYLFLHVHILSLSK